MKIICTEIFLDGRDRFEAGDVRVVDDAAGARFIANGWACENSVSGAVGALAGAIKEVALDVHSARHAQGVTHG